MFTQAITTNIIIDVLESMLLKFDIRLKDYHRDILAILIPSIAFRDGHIIILASTIRAIDKVIKRRNDKLSFTRMLLAINMISDIDKYGTISIPLAWILNKLEVKKDIIHPKETKISKKILYKSPTVLMVSQFLANFGVPKYLSVPIVNIVIELFSWDLQEEYKIVQRANVAFKGYKMSDTKAILKTLQVEKILLSTLVLLALSYLPFNLRSPLILVSVLSELYEVFMAIYKTKSYKGFLLEGYYGRDNEE